jgi:hypothetical protein
MLEQLLLTVGGMLVAQQTGPVNWGTAYAAPPPPGVSSREDAGVLDHSSFDGCPPDVDSGCLLLQRVRKMGWGWQNMCLCPLPHSTLRTTLQQHA